MGTETWTPYRVEFPAEQTSQISDTLSRTDES